MAQVSETGRPYRSRLRPACLACKKRKTRCKIDDSSATCDMCKFHATNCVFPDLGRNSVRNASSAEASGGSRRRNPRSSTYVEKDFGSSMDASAPRSRETAPTQPQGRLSVPSGGALLSSHCPDNTLHDPSTSSSHPSRIAYTEGEDDNVHVVGPVMASDKEILEAYLSTMGQPRPLRTAIQTSSRGTIRPIQFTTVPRRPFGMNRGHNPAASNRRIIEKIIEPFETDLIQLYFEKGNSCMPLFEHSLFLDTYAEHRENLSPALLSNLYANALTYWYSSPLLSLRRKPDVQFIWIQANEALHSEMFISPGVSAVMALLLNSSGRPSTSPFGNGGYVGTAVALANGLGLNRNPSDWEIPQVEKDLRAKIWWFLVVQDRWSSFNYGTPPQISQAHYDVPTPTIETLFPKGASDRELSAGSIFISLVELTEVLGCLLEHVYDLRKGASQEGSVRSSDNVYSRLITWKGTLKGLAYSIVVDGIVSEIPGAANFRLAYLATELLLCRIQLDLDKQQSGALDKPSSSRHQIQAHRVAEDIVLQVQALQESDLRGYWLPATAATLTSATAFLLRSAIRSITSGSLRDRNGALQSAIDMIAALRSHHQRYEWDIASSCIEQYGELVDKMAALMNLQQTGGSEEINPQPLLQPDVEDFLSHAMDGSAMGMDMQMLDLWGISET